MKVDDLNLSVRGRNILIRNGIDDTRDLTIMSKGDLLKLRNCGRGVVEDVERALYEVGLHLKEQTL